MEKRMDVRMRLVEHIQHPWLCKVMLAHMLCQLLAYVLYVAGIFQEMVTLYEP